MVNNCLSLARASGGCSGEARESVPVLDFDDPEIGIAAAPLAEDGVNLRLRRRRRGLDNPAPLAIVVDSRPGCGSKQVKAAVKMIDDHEDGACLLRSLADHRTK